MRTNCVNCGAAIDTSVTKCPFCGTSYFDLTSIDFSSPSPAYFHLKIPSSHGDLLMTMLARPKLEDMTIEEDGMKITGGRGEALWWYTSEKRVALGISIHPVPMPDNNTLFTVELGRS